MRLKKVRCPYCKRKEGYLEKSYYTFELDKTYLRCVRCGGSIVEKCTINDCLELLGSGAAVEKWLWLVEHCYRIGAGQRFSFCKDTGISVQIWEREEGQSAEALEKWMSGDRDFRYGKKEEYKTLAEALDVVYAWAKKLLEGKKEVPQL